MAKSAVVEYSTESELRINSKKTSVPARKSKRVWSKDNQILQQLQDKWAVHTKSVMEPSHKPDPFHVKFHDLQRDPLQGRWRDNFFICVVYLTTLSVA
jgi:hypothetical protein